MKRKPEDLSPEDQEYTRKLLVAAGKTAHKNESMESFLEGLLTPSEQIMLGRRIWIARMLLENKGFAEIGERLHVGPTTITNVELQLLGLIPDYGEHIKKLRRKATTERRKQIIRDNPFSFAALKQKYPFHFLLFPWPRK